MKSLSQLNYVVTKNRNSLSLSSVRTHTLQKYAVYYTAKFLKKAPLNIFRTNRGPKAEKNYFHFESAPLPPTYDLFCVSHRCYCLESLTI